MKVKVLGCFILLGALLLWDLATPRQTPKLVMDETRTTTYKIKFLDEALRLVKEDTNIYPKTSIGLNAIYENWDNTKNWQGPYVRKKISTKDSWGRELIYKYPHNCVNNTDSFALYSVGKNGIDECLEGDDIYVEQD